MSKSSILALKEQLSSGKLESDRAYILSYIKTISNKGRGVTLPALESYFEMKTSTIVGRLSELEDMGLIYKDGVEKINKPYSNTYSYSKYFYEADEFKQAENREKVHLAKFRKSVKSLMKRFSEEIPPKLMFQLEQSLNVQKKLNI